MAAPQKPTAIIFGGINTVSRTVASFLVPIDANPLVSHLRIVDKFSVAPPTVYLGAEFPKVLGKPNVEYKQLNLTVPSAVSAAFDPPEGVSSYDYVFDLSGEVQVDRLEKVQISMTFNVARLIGLEAAKRKVKALVRLQHPWYTTPEKGSHDEKEDVKPLEVIGTWWHETLRMLAAIENLNLVILRIGFVHGPYVNFGIVAPFAAVAATYGYIKQPMKSLWGPGKHNMWVTHSEDVAGGMWACAEWMAQLGRNEADAIAGEEIIFHNDKSKVREVEGMAPHDQKVIAPLFNLTSDTNVTLAEGGRVLTSYFGTSVEFINMLMNSLAKFKLDGLIEEINEAHVTTWTEMITTSNPPVPNTPITSYMDKYMLSKHSVAFGNAKIKNVIGYKLRRPYFDHEVVGEMIDKWKAEGSWPIPDKQ